MYHIPEVSVSVNGKEQIMSVLSRDLMSKRTIYLNGEINDEAALSIITQLHYLEDNSQEPITLVINSPGGSVSAGLAIYDVMQALSCPVTTAAVGTGAGSRHEGPPLCLAQQPRHDPSAAGHGAGAGLRHSDRRRKYSAHQVQAGRAPRCPFRPHGPGHPAGL